jgi:hypothetical protein
VTGAEPPARDAYDDWHTTQGGEESMFLSTIGKTAGIWLTAAALLYAGRPPVQAARNPSESQGNPAAQEQQKVPSQEAPSAAPSASQVPSAAQKAELEREQQRMRRAQIYAYRRSRDQLNAARREQARANQVSAMHRMLNPWAPASIRASNQRAQAYQNAAQNRAAYMGARTSPYYGFYLHAQGW